MAEDYPTGDYSRLEADRDRLKLENQSLNLHVEDLQKAIDGIAPYCKVKYGMDEDAVNAIERLAYKGTQARKCTCLCHEINSGSPGCSACGTSHL